MFDLGRSVAVQRQDKFVDLHDRLKKLLKVREQKTESLVFYDIGLWMGEDHLKAMQQYGRLPGSGFFFFFLIQIVQYFVRIPGLKERFMVL